MGMVNKMIKKELEKRAENIIDGVRKAIKDRSKQTRQKFQELRETLECEDGVCFIDSDPIDPEIEEK